MKQTLVTPSFAPDYERCKLLVHSTEKYLDGVDQHLILVDAQDMALFSQLSSQKTQIVCKEDVLPVSLRRVPGQKKWWLHSGLVPIRGWVLQQVIKLYVAATADADAVVFADSDLFFRKHFDLNTLWDDGKLRMFRNERSPELHAERRYKRWYKQACKYFDLGEQEDQRGAYIAQMNAMRPSVVRRMCEEIEQQSGRVWYKSLLLNPDFSEFILYGAYVEARGAAQCGHFLEDRQICHSSWFYDIRSEEDIRNFVAKTKPEHYAIHLQSNLGLDYPELAFE